MRALWRLGFWGILAAVALAAAVWAAQSDLGVQKLAAMMAARPGVPTAAQLLARSNDTENETRRLAEAVRMLGEDRDRLIARIRTLERDIDEVTDSLAHVRSAQALPLPAHSMVASAGPAAPAQPAPSAPEAEAGRMVAPQPLPPPPLSLVPVPASQANIPVGVYESPTGAITPRTEFGVDLGSGTDIDSLRALWISIRGKHAALVEGLRPIVTIREGARPGEMELRLVAGPLVNAGAAARLCGLLGMVGLVCQPAVFDGQRLAGIRNQ